MIRIALLDRSKVTSHRVPILFDDPRIARQQPGCPGHDDACVAPACAVSGIWSGSAGREDTVHWSANLRRSQISSEFFRKWRETHVVGRCTPEDFGVSGPAEALVALGAVGGYADEV